MKKYVKASKVREVINASDIDEVISSDTMKDVFKYCDLFKENLNMIGMALQIEDIENAKLYLKRLSADVVIVEDCLNEIELASRSIIDQYEEEK